MIARVAFQPAGKLLFLLVVASNGCAARNTATLRRPSPAHHTVDQAIRLPVPDFPKTIPQARWPVNGHVPQLQASTQPEPCVFRGSLLVETSLTLSLSDGPLVAYFNHNAPIQVERLELPKAPGERAKVVIASPIQMEGYFDFEAEVVQLVERVEVVPEHLWLRPSTAVNAVLSSAGSATITASFRELESPSEFTTEISCANLVLKQKWHHDQTQVPENQLAYLDPPIVSIHAKPAGQEVAAIGELIPIYPQFRPVRIIETKQQ